MLGSGHIEYVVGGNRSREVSIESRARNVIYFKIKEIFFFSPLFLVILFKNNLKK